MGKKKRFEKIKKMLCVLWGHPPVITECLGYIYCARCEEQIGDALGGVFDTSKKANLAHAGCLTCREVIKNMTWKERLLTPLSK